MNRTNLFRNVVLCGTYYNPANKHYDLKGVVNCDRCHRQNLNVCIGSDDNVDLCMDCVKYFHEHDSACKTRMMSSDYKPKSK